MIQVSQTQSYHVVAKPETENSRGFQFVDVCRMWMQAHQCIYVLNMFSFQQVRMNRATTLRAFKVFKGKSDWQSGVVLARQSMSEKCKRIDCQTNMFRQILVSPLLGMAISVDE